MNQWDTEATKQLVRSYHEQGLLTTSQAAELEALADKGTPDLALGLLGDIGEE